MAGILLMLVLFITLNMHDKSSVYEHEKMKNLETLSLVSVLLTVFIALYIN